MVCLGNICRSPVAEATLRKAAYLKGLNFEIDSAGTAGYHIGEAPDKRTISNAFKFGLDVSMLRARQFDSSDFEKFDLIFAMDRSNYQNLKKMAGNNREYANKIHMYGSYTGLNTDEIPDPYYGNESDFDLVFKLCEEAAKKLVEKLNPK